MDPLRTLKLVRIKYVWTGARIMNTRNPTIADGPICRQSRMSVTASWIGAVQIAWNHCAQ